MPSKIKEKLGSTWYNIGFIENVAGLATQEDVDKRIHWLDRGDYNDGWFADPVIYSVNDREIITFVEEFVYATHKGRLSELVIDRSAYKLKQIIPILDLETHLSFPIFCKHDGKTYVYPENSQCGRLKIYEYDETSHQLVNPQVLVDAPLVDPQILEMNGKYYVLSTQFKSLAKLDDDLFVYESDSLFGPYKLVQVLHNDIDEERGAGRIFSVDNRLIRPAQSSVGGYGKQLIFYELSYTGNRFKEKEILRLSPCPTKMDQQLHTYNQMGNLVVVDGNEFVYKNFAKVYNKLFRSFLHKIS